MCDICDGKVTLEEYFGVAPTGRLLNRATEREVFRHVREGWWGMDCQVCRYRVVGCATRLEAEFALLAHCYEDHRQE